MVAGSGLSLSEIDKANSTIDILGFNEKDDIRKRKRADVWAYVELQLDAWNKTPSNDMLTVIASGAAVTGHWSIWLTVFAAHPQVIARFNQVFPGTARCCFDPKTAAAIPRPGGQL